MSSLIVNSKLLPASIIVSPSVMLVYLIMYESGGTVGNGRVQDRSTVVLVGLVAMRSRTDGAKSIMKN